jgi:hypothetical protein
MRTSKRKKLLMLKLQQNRTKLVNKRMKRWWQNKRNGTKWRSLFCSSIPKKTDDEDVLENEEEETTDIEMAREIYYHLNQFLIKIIVIVIVVDTKIYFSNSKVVGWWFWWWLWCNYYSRPFTPNNRLIIISISISISSSIKNTKTCPFCHLYHELPPCLINSQNILNISGLYTSIYAVIILL